jgi:Cys-tRNA synthase (O-phospho-L-seryl-tRNA:Cys-tRNA synthase)
MEEKTCAVKFGDNYRMCDFCSTVQFDAEGNTFWKCNKYNKVLKDEDKLLWRCKECIDNK